MGQVILQVDGVTTLGKGGGPLGGSGHPPGGWGHYPR